LTDSGNTATALASGMRTTQVLRVPFESLIVVGVVTAAVAVFPYREMVERDERIEGLEVLREEWHGLASASATPQQDTDRFIELLWKLYGRR
jgi:hypothetical protein